MLAEFNITHIRKSKASGLSGGERRRLEIARCLVSNPKIVMLDEPFAGIDPVTVQSIQGVIQQLRESGIAVLITDHAAREILGTVDRCYVIYQGKVLVDGTPDEVKMHPKVREEYLGDLDAAARTAASRVGYDDADEFVAVGDASGNGVPTPHIGKSTMRRVTDV